MTAVPKSNPAYRGQAIYSRVFLPTYDAIVYGFNSPYLWRCPLSRLVAHYDEHLSDRHLDVGVASGRPTADHNRPGRATIDLNNRLGVMSNYQDTAAAIDAELNRHFTSHHLEIVGTVALFSARAD